jgi:hypothetical protein
MPFPTKTLETLRPDIAGSLTEFDLELNQRGFIGYRVFPVLEVGLAADTFGKITIESLLQTKETRRAPGANYNRGDFQFTNDSYATEEHGFEIPVDEKQARLYRNFFDAEMVAAAKARHIVLLNAEQRVVDLLTDTSVYTGAARTTAITNEWDDYTNATPIADVEGAVRKVWDATGIWPNALVINRKEFRNLRNCDEIIERIQSAGAGNATKPTDITPEMLALVFDLDYVIVQNSAKNSAKEGAAASIAPVWPDEYASVCRVATTNDIQEPCIGRTFHWAADGSEVGGLVETYYEQRPRAQIVRVRHDVDEKILYTELAHLLSNVTTI